MARRVASRMFTQSIVAASAEATAQARACSRMRAASSRRRSGVRHLLSSTPGSGGRCGSAITAAATTGPAKQPRPASSTPASRT
jgi:hypothetical protein